MRKRRWLSAVPVCETETARRTDVFDTCGVSVTTVLVRSVAILRQYPSFNDLRGLARGSNNAAVAFLYHVAIV